MNEELYKDLCIVMAFISDISAKRIFEGDIGLWELEAIKEDWAEYIPKLTPELLTRFQIGCLSKSEPDYFKEATDIPFQEFIEQLESRIANKLFLATIFKELSDELASKLNVDRYALTQGDITYHQIMAIRSVMSQVEKYETEDVEKFIKIIKERKEQK